MMGFKAKGLLMLGVKAKSFSALLRRLWGK
jgi:hypothetical protein